jgi:hypothetical protein
MIIPMSNLLEHASVFGSRIVIRGQTLHFLQADYELELTRHVCKRQVLEISAIMIEKRTKYLA